MLRILAMTIKTPDHIDRGLVFIGDIFHNVLYVAVEDLAKRLNGVGADAFIALETGDLTGADMILLD